jgi:hypothetical protein
VGRLQEDRKDRGDRKRPATEDLKTTMMSFVFFLREKGFLIEGLLSRM